MQPQSVSAAEFRPWRLRDGCRKAATGHTTILQAAEEYNEWRKGGDGYWRYLNGNGVMAVDSWVDNDDYYVDSNGIMVAGKWLQVPNSDADTGYDWYYFNSTGKCMKERWEKINNNWYYFDDTGLMQTGWVLDDMYYCGSNGVMQTGWQRLAPPDGYEDEEEDNGGPFETEDDGKYWYYFNSNGKKVVPDSDGDNVKQKKINGEYYCLREDGAMQTGWVCVTGDESDSIADYRFVDANGQVRSGWYTAEPRRIFRISTITMWSGFTLTARENRRRGRRLVQPTAVIWKRSTATPTCLDQTAFRYTEFRRYIWIGMNQNIRRITSAIVPKAVCSAENRRLTMAEK